MTSDFTRRGGLSLSWIVVAPSIWVIHFLASYWTAAIYCAKYADLDRSAADVQWWIMIYTVVALIPLVVIAAIGFLRHRSGHAGLPHDESSRADQRRLIGWATFLLSLLSAVATIFTALVAYFLGSCH